MDGRLRQKLDEQAAAKLREIARTMDEEIGHFAADQVLLDLLAEAGFPETIEAFEAIDKWYA